MNWISEAVADSGHRSPVKDALREVLDDIARMRLAGASWAAIFRKLKKEGKNVGAGVSSFNNARYQLKDELDALLAELRADVSQDAPVSPEVDQPTPSTQTPRRPVYNRDRFADDRKPLAFGEH